MKSEAGPPAYFYNTQTGNAPPSMASAGGVTEDVPGAMTA